MKEMEVHCSDEILSRIYKNDQSVWKEVYYEYFDMVSRFIIANNGDMHEAKDVYHYALKVIYEKARNKELELTCSLKTFIYSICRNKWMEELRKRKKLSLKDSFTDTEYYDHEEMASIDFSEYDLDEIVHFHFSRLNERCKKLLKLLKLSAKEVAKIMGYSSPQYARKQKSLCLKRLAKQVKMDSRVKELM